MIRRHSYLRKSSKPIPRRVRPRLRKRGARANLARECAALWSRVVTRGCGCWLRSSFCRGPLDAAHAFPKGACPAVRYDPAYGLPTCRFHHELYANGQDWHELLRLHWGRAVYAEHYAAAHISGARLNLVEVKRSLQERA